MRRGADGLRRVLWFLLASWSPALAAGPMSVQDAIERAQANSPALKTARARVGGAKAAQGAVWEAYAPQVLIFGGVQRNEVGGSTTTTTSTTPGLFGSTTTVSQHFSQSATQGVLGASVEEFLFDFGTFSGQRTAAGERYGAQKEALATQSLDVELNVKVAYYTLLRANRFVRHQQELVDQRRALLGAAAKNAAGEGKDAAQADLGLAEARLALNKGENDLADAELAFLDAIGEPGASTPPLVDDVTMKMILVSPQQMVERARSSRPELNQAEAIVRAQQAEVDAARAGYFPRVASYFNVTSLNSIDNADLNRLTVLGGGLAVRVPTTWMVSTDRLAQAEAGLQEAKARAEEIRQAITLAVARSNAALSEAVERVRITNELAENANRRWEESQARSRRGLRATADSRAAYALVYDARIRLLQALYDAKIAEAKLERAIGFDF